MGRKQTFRCPTGPRRPHKLGDEAKSVRQRRPENMPVTVNICEHSRSLAGDLESLFVDPVAVIDVRSG